MPQSQPSARQGQINVVRSFFKTVKKDSSFGKGETTPSKNHVQYPLAPSKYYLKNLAFTSSGAKISKNARQSEFSWLSGDSGSIWIFMKKIGFILSAAAIGIFVFIGCGSRNGDTKELSERVKTPSTVAANLSAEDTAFIALGKAVSAAFTNTITNAQVLYKIGNVKMSYVLADDIKKVVTEEQVKAKFELVLRRNDIPIVTTDEKPSVVLQLLVNGFLNQSDILCYKTQFRTIEFQPVYRQGEWRYALVTTWDDAGNLQTVEKSLAGDAILSQIEKGAEIFANDYLAANPKK